MAELREETQTSKVFGGVEIENNQTGTSYETQGNKTNYQNMNNGYGEITISENQKEGNNVVNCGTINRVYGGVEVGGLQPEGVQASNNGSSNNLPTKVGFWSKFRAFWLQEIDWNREIKVELTPYQQKIENEINEFLHQEITWEKVYNFLFKEINFGKNRK